MTHPCPLKLLSELRLPAPRSIVHVGANSGRDEVTNYKKSFAKTCLYIEPLPSIFQELVKNLKDLPNHLPIQALCSDRDDEEIIFNVASNEGRSSSIFPWGNHKNLYPNTDYLDQLKIKTKTLDTLLEDYSDTRFDLLVMDTQGAELKILKGSHKFLEENCSYIYTEIGEDPLYEGGCTFSEITSFLEAYGFRLKNMELNYKNWGNALYVKDVPSPKVNIALNKPTRQSSISMKGKVSSSAVNGSKDGNPSFCTEKETNPWWEVDLDQDYIINEIRLYNCIDYNDESVKTLKVLISSDQENWETVYINDEQLVFGGVAGRPLLIEIKNQQTRYIRLQLNEFTQFHLDEVEVYGTLSSQQLK